MSALKPRSRVILKALIEQYIQDGLPVGSRSLSKISGLDLSPATIRNIMSDLEELGYISSPHTSAGRVPTAEGYRLFVDTLLVTQPPEQKTVSVLQDQLIARSPLQLINSTSQLLSKLTNFVSIVQTPRRNNLIIRHIEFICLSERKILLILVSEDGDVHNHMLVTERHYTQAELTEAAQCLNSVFVGHNIDTLQHKLSKELKLLSTRIAELMQCIIDANTLASTPQDTCILSGEHNLFEIDGFSSNLARLKDLFALFEQKTGLMELMNTCAQAPGIKIFIGKESGLTPLDMCSIVTAPYELNGQPVGILGIIGPTRMAYERMIPIVDITARILSSALSNTDTDPLTH